MEQVFLELFNMSVSAGWVILAVLVLRLLLKRAPKNTRMILWAVVGFRLVCPFSLESALSLIPSTQTIAPEALYDPLPEVNSGIPAVNEVVNPVFSESFAADVTASVNPLQVALTVAGYVWIIGMAAMALYGIISYAVLRRKVAASVRLRENIWLSDHVPTPFILGWIKPRIILPSDMPEDLYEPVIAHERAHLKRGDHWIKLAGFVLLCVYWFHPLVWAAYILLSRDIELACDERVIRQMETDEKKAYSEALLAYGIKTHRIVACPLAFGEVGVKQRIKAVLHYKKPTLWIIIAAVVALSILTVCFLTNPNQTVLAHIDVFDNPLWTTGRVPEGVYTRFALTGHEEELEVLMNALSSKKEWKDLTKFDWCAFITYSITLERESIFFKDETYYFASNGDTVFKKSGTKLFFADLTPEEQELISNLKKWAMKEKLAIDPATQAGTVVFGVYDEPLWTSGKVPSYSSTSYSAPITDEELAVLGEIVSKKTWMDMSKYDGAELVDYAITVVSDDAQVNAHTYYIGSLNIMIDLYGSGLFFAELSSEEKDLLYDLTLRAGIDQSDLPTSIVASWFQNG